MKTIAWQIVGRKLPPRLLLKLRHAGYNLLPVGHAANAQCKLALFSIHSKYCVGCPILLQTMLRGLPIPKLVITAATGDQRAAMIRAGADDVVSPDVAAVELFARVDNLIWRRNRIERQISIGPLKVDLLSRRVWRSGQEIRLLPREFDLLVALARTPGIPFSRRDLLKQVWDQHFEPNTNSVEVHVCRLRGKIDNGHAIPIIHTLRGQGYFLAGGDNDRPAFPFIDNEIAEPHAMARTKTDMIGED